MKVTFQKFHQRARDGDESLAAAQVRKRAVPQRTKKSGGLNMDLKNDWQLVQQTKNCRLRKPGVNKVSTEHARPSDSIPRESAATRGGKPLDRKICLQAIMFLKINKCIFCTGHKESNFMSNLHQCLTGFHYLQTIGCVRRNCGACNGYDVHEEASSRLMIESPRITFQLMET